MYTNILVSEKKTTAALIPKKTILWATFWTTFWLTLFKDKTLLFKADLSIFRIQQPEYIQESFQGS